MSHRDTEFPAFHNLATPMRTKFIIVFILLLLFLAACGTKGPVRPVGTTLPDSGGTEAGKQPGNCCN